MIIDKILDRYDGDAYDPEDFYNAMMSYEEGTDFPISRALDSGEEEDIKRELCAYIDDGNYNPKIKDFINSVKWLEADDGKDYSKEFDILGESKKGESKFKCSMAKKKESLAKKSEANNDWVAYYFCKDPKGYEWAVMPHQVIGNGANVGCVNDRGGQDDIGLKYALEECEPLNQSLESSKIYKAVSDGEDRTIIPLTLADATRIANAGNDKLAVLGIIADMHLRKSESKKSEATYDRPVSLYITTRYDDAEEAQNFIKDMVGEELTVSKDRNGDALYVSIEGSDDAIDAFLEVYKDEYENILNDCDVDANGWVSPDDTYYSSIEGRKELMGESTKK